MYIHTYKHCNVNCDAIMLPTWQLDEVNIFTSLLLLLSFQEGLTPLMVAVQTSWITDESRRSAAVDILLNANADLNTQENVR